MSHILAHVFDDRTYYVRVLKDKWEEIYNPNYATQFTSQIEAEDWSRQNTTLGEYAKGLLATKEIIKFNEWQQQGMIRRTFPLVDRSMSRPYNNENPNEVLKWRIWASENSDLVRYEDYKTWPELYQKFKHLFSVQRYSDKDYKNYYITVSVCSNKQGKYGQFKKELHLALPYITYIEKGYKIFHIFDYFLSEHGNSCDLFYRNDQDCYIKGRYESKHKGTLSECFDYIKKYRYYPED